jgi:hypothetical protein
MMLVGIQDRGAGGDRPLRRPHARVLVARVRETMGPRAGVFDISLRAYGWNAVSGLPAMPAPAVAPREIGLMFVATAETQQIATQIAKTCNPLVLPPAAEPGQEMPSYAFPFSPAEVERGRVYEFKLNHVVHVDSPMELVRTEFVNAKEACMPKVSRSLQPCALEERRPVLDHARPALPR